MKEYIDKEAAKNAIYSEISQHYKDIGNSLYGLGYHNGLTKAYSILLDAPASDVAEVKHAEWIPYDSDESYGPSNETLWYKCSVCGSDAHGRCYDDEWYSELILSKYCPKCGAKMDGGKR